MQSIGYRLRQRLGRLGAGWRAFISVAETSITIGLLAGAYAFASDALFFAFLLFCAWAIASAGIATSALRSLVFRGALIVLCALLFAGYGIFLRTHMPPAYVVAAQADTSKPKAAAQRAPCVQIPSIGILNDGDMSGSKIEGLKAHGLSKTIENHGNMKNLQLKNAEIDADPCAENGIDIDKMTIGKPHH